MNVLITGIAGSGASYLAEYIVENHPEAQVHGLARWHSTTSHNNLKNIKNKIIIHECDMCDLPSIIRVLREIKPIKIFNMASNANVKVCFDTPIAVFDNNVKLMHNLLEAIRLECPETILQQCSTSEVYGTPLITPITEIHPINPSNPYAASKLAQEALCWTYHKTWKLNIVITRAFCYCNPRRKEIFSTSFAKQIVDIENGKLDVLRHGNLSSIRTMIDIRDISRAYWLASNKCEYGIPYNLGGKEILEVGEFMMTLIENAKCHIWTYEDPLLFRPVDVTSQIPDTTKFDILTGFSPMYTLEDSIQWLLEECRKDIKNES